MGILRYAITDRSRMGATVEDWAAACVRLAGRVDYLLVRERDLPAGELERLAVAVLRGMEASGAPRFQLMIHNRLDVALAVGAGGLHLAADRDGLTPRQVRKAYSLVGLPAPVISMSVHSAEAAVTASREGADLLLFAPVFGKRVAGNLVVDPTGLSALAAAVRAAAPTPVLALGGVTADNAASCVEAGAAGVASIRMYF